MTEPVPSAYSAARAAFLDALLERHRAWYAYRTLRDTSEAAGLLLRFLAADALVEDRWAALWPFWFAEGLDGTGAR
jgi:hypothetical protein